MAFEDRFKTYTSNIKNNRFPAGTNGLTELAPWECYMLVKYGHKGKFGLGGKQEYLVEIPCYPDEVTESIAAQWKTQTVLGRSAPLIAYANTDLKSVNFSINLHRDFLTGSFSHTEETLQSINGNLKKQAAGSQIQSADGPFDTRQWYVNVNKLLQVSCYPQYTENGLIPPTTYFIFGQMILKGFVQSYSTSWKKPILNSFYGWNTVTIQMDCYPDTIISADNILSNSGAASTQNTYNTEFPSSNTVKSDLAPRYRYRSNNRGGESLGGSLRHT